MVLGDYIQGNQLGSSWLGRNLKLVNGVVESVRKVQEKEKALKIARLREVETLKKDLRECQNRPPEVRTITKEVLKEVPKVVVKEVVKQIPVKEVVVKEVPKIITKEVIKEVPVPAKETKKDDFFSKNKTAILVTGAVVGTFALVKMSGKK